MTPTKDLARLYATLPTPFTAQDEPSEPLPA